VAEVVLDHCLAFLQLDAFGAHLSMDQNETCVSVWTNECGLRRLLPDSSKEHLRADAFEKSENRLNKI
jgi:hypothetical protein